MSEPTRRHETRGHPESWLRAGLCTPLGELAAAEERALTARLAILVTRLAIQVTRLAIRATRIAILVTRFAIRLTRLAIRVTRSPFE